MFCTPSQVGRWTLTESDLRVLFQPLSKRGQESVRGPVNTIRDLGVLFDLMEVQIQKVPIGLTDQIDNDDA